MRENSFTLCEKDRIPLKKKNTLISLLAKKKPVLFKNARLMGPTFSRSTRGLKCTLDRNHVSWRIHFEGYDIKNCMASHFISIVRKEKGCCSSHDHSTLAFERALFLAWFAIKRKKKYLAPLLKGPSYYKGSRLWEMLFIIKKVFAFKLHHQHQPWKHHHYHGIFIYQWLAKWRFVPRNREWTTRPFPYADSTIKGDHSWYITHSGNVASMFIENRRAGNSKFATFVPATEVCYSYRYWSFK